MNRERLEQRAGALESVADCYVARRSTAQGEERAVVYVVPGRGVHLDRLEEWTASIRRDGMENGTDLEAGCDVVAVARLPLTVDGVIDDSLLAQQAVMDQELVLRWQEALKRIPGVQDAAAMVETAEEPLPPLHTSALFLEEDVEAHTESESASSPVSRDAAAVDTPLEGRLAVSEGGEIRDADLLPKRLAEMLQRAAERHPYHGLRTLTDGREEFLSYPELISRAECLLGGLRAAGLQPGDRVLFQLPHQQEFLISFWACLFGGFVPVPMGPVISGMSGGAAKLQHAWKILDASLVLTNRELQPHLRAILGEMDLPDALVQCTADLNTAEEDKVLHVGAPDDLALMMLTSGSTGMPKAVMLSHRNLIRRQAGSVQQNGFTSDEVTLSWMPLDHVAGIVYFHLRDVFLGCQQIHAATELVTWDPLLWLEWIDRYRVTITFAPNFAFGLVNDRGNDLVMRATRDGSPWDLSCLHHLLNGAEAIVPRTARRFLQMFAPYRLPADAMWPVWGMSETSSGTLYSETFRLETSSDDDALVEVGRPIPGLSVRIVNENDEPVLEGETGRLQVRGDQVMAGYFHRPDLTAEAFTEDGWFKTGDLGLIKHGRVTISGREKDVIVINSVNYSCHEIEGLVEEVDGVETSFTAACAIREPGTNTDRLAIFFHPSAGCDVVPVELLRAIRSAVSLRLGLNVDYLLPVERETIPKTNIGKIQRTQLAVSFSEGKFVDTVRRVEVLLGGAHTLPDWFFEPVWRRAQLRGQREVGHALVFADERGLGDRLQREIGSDCVLVTQGKQFVEDGARFVIDAGDGEHYVRLLQSLAKRQFIPQTVTHLWTYGGEAADPDDLEQVRRSQQTGLLSVWRLTQALRTAETRVKLVVVSSGMQAVGNVKHEVEFAKAPLLGLLKTLPQENPRLECCHVDLPVAANETNAALLLAEMRGLVRDTEVAYREEERWVRKLRKIAFGAKPMAPVSLKRGGMYLLSGGMGGIGVELAHYLLKHYAVHLLLLGRTNATDRMEALHAAAQATGGRVMYAVVDVTDASGLQQVVAEAEADFGRELDGIFHLAGRYQERLLEDESEASLMETLEPKLGALTLHRLVKDKADALFVSFSSVNGYLGGYGAGAYAAANTWLESFTEYQRATTRLRAYSVAWSMWNDVGMSRGYAGKAAARARGFYAISSKQGMASLMALLGRSPGNTLVGLDGASLHVRRMSGDLLVPAQRLSAVVSGVAGTLAFAAKLKIEDRYGVRSTCRVRKAEAAMLDVKGNIDRTKRLQVAEPAAPEVPSNGLEATIAEIWRDVLGLDQLSATENFFDLGGSSLTMGQANGRLQEMLQRKISMTESFQYATVRTLAAHLSGVKDAGDVSALSASQSRGEKRRERLRARQR